MRQLPREPDEGLEAPGYGGVLESSLALVEASLTEEAECTYRGQENTASGRPGRQALRREGSPQQRI
jgi:hypothetical protein